MSLKNYSAGGAIAKYRLVKFSADGVVVQGAAATDNLIGVVDIPKAAVLNDRVDVVRDDIALVELGGTVVAGDFITSDTVGRGVKAAPAAGVNNRVAGVVETGGVIGDIIYVNIINGSIQG